MYVFIPKVKWPLHKDFYLAFHFCKVIIHQPTALKFIGHTQSFSEWVLVEIKSISEAFFQLS